MDNFPLVFDEKSEWCYECCDCGHRLPHDPGVCVVCNSDLSYTLVNWKADEDKAAQAKV